MHKSVVKSTRPSQLLKQTLRAILRTKLHDLPWVLDSICKFDTKFYGFYKDVIRASRLINCEYNRFCQSRYPNKSLRHAVNCYLENQQEALRIYGPIEDWNTSQITDMSYMFHGANSFNGDISRWNVKNVANMKGMFNGATSFNGDISKWNVENVANMKCIFNGVKSNVKNEKDTTFVPHYNIRSNFIKNINAIFNKIHNSIINKLSKFKCTKF